LETVAQASGDAAGTGSATPPAPESPLDSSEGLPGRLAAAAPYTRLRNEVLARGPDALSPPSPQTSKPIGQEAPPPAYRQLLDTMLENPRVGAKS
jgi:hypothetical protein